MWGEVGGEVAAFVSHLGEVLHRHLQHICLVNSSPRLGEIGNQDFKLF